MAEAERFQGEPADRDDANRDDATGKYRRPGCWLPGP
jgi:hypothetical protein